ncbi:putative cytochrome p450 protein [Penicillium brasilianum]|uniref:Putative cytochrome p450 protein n=1 Tax=Penicillium brasilianum TaxID=104259 RepID=A0A1S9R8Z1_PENBI|nr:putative cytochrome p450 protein [Penicillium brasilianum]
MLCLLASASGFVPRAAPGVGESFGLFAYGDSIGGLSIFYADGKAFVGDPSNSTSSSAVPVSFERPSLSLSEWIANPNTTSSATTTDRWSDELLYIPSSSSSSRQMGFTSKAESNETTTGFIFYGQWVMVETESGDISSSFYVKASSEGEGINSLLWNATDDDAAIPISLRSVKPSNS